MLKRFGTSSSHGGTANSTPELAMDRPASSQEESAAIIESNKVPIVYLVLCFLRRTRVFLSLSLINTTVWRFRI